MRKTLRTLLVPIGTALTLAVPATASAAFDLATPLEGSKTTANAVPTSWVGACDAGLTCKFLTVAYSRSAAVDPATGRLVEGTSANYDLDPYKLAYAETDTATSVTSPTLNPGTWHAQLQWTQTDAQYNRTETQTAVRTFTIKHKLTATRPKVTLRLNTIRSLWYGVKYNGNAPTYKVRSFVSVQKKQGRRLVWKRVWSSKQEKWYGQREKAGSREFNFKPRNKVRAGAKIRIDVTFTAPGMKKKTVSLVTRSV